MAGLSSSYPKYAPAADLNDYLGVALPDADARLTTASGQIRSWTKTAEYSVDEDGFSPLDEATRNAFHDATVLQASAWYRAGLNPGDTPATAGVGVVQSKTLGSRSVTYAANAAADSARAELVGGGLAPEAAGVLSAAGLLSGLVDTGGYGDYPSLISRTRYLESVADGGEG